MLAAHANAGSFLESPAPEIDALLVQSAAEPPGTVIGRYKLLEEIAEGGMGVVYMAEQREPVRRKVALKIVKPGMDTREVIARFEAERQALAMMDHPNIAKVFDAGETESGRSYFVMELVRGLPLTEYCDKNELTIQERLALFVQVCQTIHHAHQKGIIHRDIKPSNVMVTHRDGTPVPKVIDFGIAKALHGAPLTERTLFTRYGQMIGTPLYMSPEQAEMSDLDIDTRSDIYSLGVMLYELLTGSTPFDLEKVKKAAFDEVRRMIREDEPPPPSTRVSTLKAEETEVFSQRKSDPVRLGSQLRRDLDWIVMKALEKDRSRRYDTASDLAADVQRYLAGEPVTAAPPSTRYRLGKWVRRHRKLVSTVAVFIIGGAAAAGVMLAATLIVRWRDARGREATVETSQPSTVNISKDGSVSIVPIADNDKTKAAESGIQPADGPALKDFFNGVPGRWVPVFRSEHDLGSARFFGSANGEPPANGITFQSGVVKFENERVVFPAFKSSVQGIRAKLKCDSGRGCLLLRTGADGSSCNANFGPNGDLVMGVSLSVNGRVEWLGEPYRRPRWKPTTSFLPIGFAVIGDLFVLEINGNRTAFLNDRITFGSPGIGSKLDKGARVYFKEIEVFVPDKDSAPEKPEPKTVALKDFANDAPGHWVPMLRSENDLAMCQIAGGGGEKITFHDGVMVVDGPAMIKLRTFKTYNQGIRGKVRFAGATVASAYLRAGGNGCYGADFHSSGLIALGISGKAAKNKPTWNDLVRGTAPKPVNGFYPFGFAAVGDSLVCEINGEYRCTARDSRIAFGFPALNSNGLALFKDIEVFVPDKDSAPPEATKPSEGSEKAGNRNSSPSEKNRG